MGGWMHKPLQNGLSHHFCHIKRFPGRKVCLENDILFVCLPRNWTHLTQPLDVGFFRPFKIAWRNVLTNWKATHKQQSPKDKKDFPQLLATTLVEMEKKSIKNDLISSFQATGIVPLDPERVLCTILFTTAEIFSSTNT